MTSTKVGVSNALTLYSNDRNVPVLISATTRPMARSSRNELERAAEDQFQNVTSLRAKGHPHTNLLRALNDQERHYPVNPDACQQHRDARKDSAAKRPTAVAARPKNRQ